MSHEIPTAPTSEKPASELDQLLADVVPYPGDRVRPGKSVLRSSGELDDGWVAIGTKGESTLVIKDVFDDEGNHVDTLGKLVPTLTFESLNQQLIERRRQDGHGVVIASETAAAYIPEQQYVEPAPHDPLAANIPRSQLWEILAEEEAKRSAILEAPATEQSPSPETPQVPDREGDSSTSGEQAALTPRQEVMAGIDFIANSIMSNRLNGRPDGTPNMMAVSLEAGLLGRMKAEDSGATAEDIATVEGMISTLRKYGTSLHMPGELSATEISQKVRAIKQRMETGS